MHPKIPAADLKAKALIRQAAMAVVGDLGFASASIRAIAAAAGVSSGLVQYHFHTKEGLRAAVDAYVMERAAEILASVHGVDRSVALAAALNDAVMAFARSDPALLAYIRRTLVDGGPSAQAMFDGLLAITRDAVDGLRADGVVRADVDPVWAALHVLVLNLGPILLQPLMDQHLDQALPSDGGIRRWQEANAALALGGMLAGPPPEPTK